MFLTYWGWLYNLVSKHYYYYFFFWNGVFFPLRSCGGVDLDGGSPGSPLLSWRSPDGYESDVYKFLNLLSDNWVLQVAAVRERQETRTIKCCKDRVTSKLVTHSIYTYAVMFTAYTLYAEQYRAEGDWSGNADYIFYIRNGKKKIYS